MSPGREGDDELFDRIVAGYSQDATDPVPRWPVAEDVAEGVTGPTPEPVRAPAPEPEVDALPSWLEPEPLEDDGHFQPPPPPRLPRPHARTVVSACTLLLGLAVVLTPNLLGLDDSVPFLLMGLVLTTGGAALLVRGMRDAPPRDSGPDDGAVV